MSGDDNTRPLTSTHYFYLFYRNAESSSTTQARKDQMIYVFQCAATDLHYIYTCTFIVLKIVWHGIEKKFQRHMLHVSSDSVRSETNYPGHCQ